MVDPNSIDELADAIRDMRDDTSKCTLLAEGALKKAESLSIDKRAKSIMDFIESRVK